MKALFLAAVLLVLACAADAAQLPLLTGPQDVSGLQATLNTIINQVNQNAILTSGAFNSGTNTIPATNSTTGTTALGGSSSSNASLVVLTVANAVNMLQIAGGASNPNWPSGGPVPTISVSGTDANINLALATQGAGVVQFASAPMWLAAPGLQACPGAGSTAPGLGISRTVTGYLLVRDFLGVAHALPSC